MVTKACPASERSPAGRAGKQAGGGASEGFPDRHRLAEAKKMAKATSEQSSNDPKEIVTRIQSILLGTKTAARRATTAGAGAIA